MQTTPDNAVSTSARAAEAAEAARAGAVRTGVARRCPQCGSREVRRSQIRCAEHGDHAFRSPYRCRECNTRFWIISRRTRVGITAIGALIAAMLVVGSVALLLARLVPERSASTTEQAASDYYEAPVPAPTAP